MPLRRSLRFGRHSIVRPTPAFVYERRLMLPPRLRQKGSCMCGPSVAGLKPMDQCAHDCP